MKTGFTLLLFASLLVKVSGSPASSGSESVSPKTLRASQWARAIALLESQTARTGISHAPAGSENIVGLESQEPSGAPKYEEVLNGYIAVHRIAPSRPGLGPFVGFLSANKIAGSRAEATRYTVADPARSGTHIAVADGSGRMGVAVGPFGPTLGPSQKSFHFARHVPAGTSSTPYRRKKDEERKRLITGNADADAVLRWSPDLNSFVMTDVFALNHGTAEITVGWVNPDGESLCTFTVLSHNRIFYTGDAGLAVFEDEDERGAEVVGLYWVVRDLLIRIYRDIPLRAGMLQVQLGSLKTLDCLIKQCANHNRTTFRNSPPQQPATTRNFAPNGAWSPQITPSPGSTSPLAVKVRRAFERASEQYSPFPLNVSTFGSENPDTRESERLFAIRLARRRRIFIFLEDAPTFQPADPTLTVPTVKNLNATKATELGARDTLRACSRRGNLTEHDASQKPPVTTYCCGGRENLGDTSTSFAYGGPKKTAGYFVAQTSYGRKLNDNRTLPRPEVNAADPDSPRKTAGVSVGTAFILAAKACDVAALASPATNVGWLMLNNMRRALASKVLAFRVDTVAADCPGSTDIFVKYTAKYFLY
ncbi:hypothetical protein C8R44DRAFT_948102 [Mycena epipterygia]|nr:hypothetical protein C8R44DRAFT_948102 [Mycena epipterygia]